MFLTHWLKRTTILRIYREVRRPKFNPAIERLEDRSVPATFAVTTTVDVVDPDDGALSLREAVLQANATLGPDTIKLPSGNFQLSLKGNEWNYLDAAAVGDLDIHGQLTIRGEGAESSSITGDFTDRLIEVLPDGVATIEGVTMSGGWAYDGGGIKNAGKLTIRDAIITNNIAAWGGGISNSGNLAIQRSTLANNWVFVSGGGVWNGGNLDVQDSAFSANSAQGAGGGIATQQELTLRNSVISANTAGTGGGLAVYQDGGVGVVIGCTIADNSAAEGGGVWNAGNLTIRASTISENRATYAGGGGISNGFTGDLTVIGSTLSGNSAQYGGGIYNGQGTATLVNCSIVDNEATGFLGYGANGGGIYNFLGRVTLRDCVVVDNDASLGGDIYNRLGTIEIYDSIFSDWYDEWL